MYSQRAARDIAALERFLGSSHQCQRCGNRFLAHEDGCPVCGSSNSYLAPIQRDLPAPADNEEVILCTITISPDGDYAITGGPPEAPSPEQT